MYLCFFDARTDAGKENNLTFGILKRSNTILTKQPIAGLLLALFLFIHVVKLTHHHDSKQTVSKAVTTVSKVVSISPDCAVCDYHFIKDSDNETATIHIQPPVISLPSYAAFLSQRTTSIGLHSSDRGPPSLV